MDYRARRNSNFERTVIPRRGSFSISGGRVCSAGSRKFHEKSSSASGGSRPRSRELLLKASVPTGVLYDDDKIGIKIEPTPRRCRTEESFSRNLADV